MFKKLLSKVVVHRAGIALAGAAVGVIAVAVCADNEAGNQQALESKKMTELNLNSVDDIPVKDRAVIMVKSHWKTGIAILGTFGLMFLSHHSMAKQLAGATVALGAVSKSYKEIDNWAKKNYPKEYAEFKKKVNTDKIKELFEKDKTLIKEGTYDGRQRYYEPWSCQIFFATDAEIKEAECTVNELVINTGKATLFDYLATFPASSGVKLESWMKYFGWYEGDTSYSYNAGYFGSYLKPVISKEKIIFHGEEEELYTISWDNNPDLDPDLSAAECRKIDDILANNADDDTAEFVRTNTEVAEAV